MDFDDLIRQAQAQELIGWDFSWLHARTEEDPLPWDYHALVLDRLHENGRPRVQAILEIETGGGELLSQRAPFPPITWATEGYPPNIPLTRARLESLGVKVADVSGNEARLPFADASFDLIINRHGDLNVLEIQRLLRTNGRFLTQQVGGDNCIDLNRALQDQVEHMYLGWSLETALMQVRETGLRVLQAREVFPRWKFKDIAGVVFYLKAIPWQISNFSVEKYRDRLYRIHQEIERTGGFTVREHRFLLELAKDK